MPIEIQRGDQTTMRSAIKLKIEKILGDLVLVYVFFQLYLLRPGIATAAIPPDPPDAPTRFGTVEQSYEVAGVHVHKKLNISIWRRGMGKVLSVVVSPDSQSLDIQMCVIRHLLAIKKK